MSKADFADICCEAVKIQETVASGRASLDDCLDSDSRREVRRALGDILFKLYRHRRIYDEYLAAHCSRRPDRRMRCLVYAALTCVWLRDGIPPEAAADGAVDAAGRLFGSRAKGFVNALMRRAAASGMPEGRHLPPEVEKRWTEFWGPERTAELDRLYGETPEFKLTWRMRSGENPVPESIPLKLDFSCPSEFYASRDAGSALRALGSSLKKRHAYIQDAATGFFTGFALPGRGARVLDMCAAPGGKSLLLADLAPGTAITACDRPGPRFRRLCANLTGSGVECVACDGRELGAKPEFAGSFDYVLADLPCSNSGVFRSRPDALWHRKFDPELAVLQAGLLTGGLKALKPGGVLMAVTCSIDPEENGAMEQTLAAAGCETSPHLLFPDRVHDGAWCCAARKPEA